MTAPARPALRYPFALLGLVCFFCTFLADGTTESGFSAEAPVLFGLLCLTGAAVGAFLLPGGFKDRLRVLVPAVFAAAALGFLALLSGGDPGLLLAAALLFLSATGLSLWMSGKLHTRQFLLLLFAAAFCLRLAYILVTPITVRQHDVGAIGCGHSHIGYIEYFYNGGSLLLPFDPRSVWQFYHPPLHHITAAIWMRFQTLLGFSYERAFENVQILTLFYSMGTLFFVERLLRRLRLRGAALILPMAVICFHPTGILFSGSINNDCLSAFLQFGALAAAVRWYDQPGLKNILYVALLVGGSMAAKLSGALCAPAIALLFLYKWWKNRQETRRYFAWFAAFAAVCVPLGLGWQILNLVRWGVPPGYVPVLSTDNYQYIGMYSPWQRLFDFFGGENANVFMAWKDRSGAGYYEYNLFLGLFKTAVFGEFTFFHPASETVRCQVGLPFANALFFVNLICMGVSLVCGVLTLFRKRFVRKDAVLSAFFAVLFAITLFSYISMCFSAPHTCTQNFRYTTPMLLCGVVWLGEGVRRTKKRSFMRSGLSVLTAVFCILSAFVYTLLLI